MFTFLQNTRSRSPEYAGGIVYAALNGETALNVLDQTEVDWIILDLHMPVMDGFGFLETIGQSPITPPIIVVSQDGSAEAKVRAHKLGAKHFLTKPVSLTDFNRIILPVDDG